MPLAFFPLTSGNLDSLLLPAYNGSLSGIPLPGWVDDPTFNSTVNCSRVRSALDRLISGYVVCACVCMWLPTLRSPAWHAACLGQLSPRLACPFAAPSLLQDAQSAILLDTVPYASNGARMRALPSAAQPACCPSCLPPGSDAPYLHPRKTPQFAKQAPLPSTSGCAACRAAAPRALCSSTFTPIPAPAAPPARAARRPTRCVGWTAALGLALQPHCGLPGGVKCPHDVSVILLLPLLTLALPALPAQQVAMYLADRQNPAYGTLRVIVTDQNDRWGGGGRKGDTAELRARPKEMVAAPCLAPSHRSM